MTITDENKKELLQFLITLQSLKALIISYNPEQLQEKFDMLQERLLVNRHNNELGQIRVLLINISVINNNKTIEKLIDVIREL